MTENNPINLQASVSHADEIFWQDVMGDIVILDPNDGSYFGAGDTGARIWQLIETPTPLSAVCDALMAEYEIDRATCEAQLIAFIERLHDAELVTISHES